LTKKEASSKPEGLFAAPNCDRPPQDQAQKAAVVAERAQRRTVGPVIIVNQQNEADEFHRIWRVDIDTQSDEIEAQRNEESQIVGPPSEYSQLKGKERLVIPEETAAPLAEGSSAAASPLNPPKFERVAKEPPPSTIAADGSDEKLYNSGSSSSQTSRDRPRLRRSNGQSRNVDIFEQPGQAETPHKTGQSRKERFKPLAPFDQDDWEVRRKRD
jgi:hypothetical protein